MGTWHVVWVPDPGGWGPLPTDGVLGVQDLPEAVARIGLRPGDPVFIRPDGMVDADLLDYVRSREFSTLERESKRNCATDTRLLLNFLSSREVPWRRVTERDLRDYRHWRCVALENPERISGAKWDREAAAFTKLFRWGRVRPMPVDVSRREDRAGDSVSSRVSDAADLGPVVGRRPAWSQPSGVPTAGWDSRTEMRNTNFVQLLLTEIRVRYGTAIRRGESGASALGPYAGRLDGGGP